MTSRRSMTSACLTAAIAVCLSSCAGQQLSFSRLLKSSDNTETVTTHPTAKPVELSEDDERSNRDSPFLKPPVETTAVLDESALPASFDAATMDLIRSELADATPEERRQWYETLKTAEPSMIPQMLNIRRMYRRDESPQASVATTARERSTDQTPRHPLENYASSSPSGSPPPTVVRPAESSRPRRDPAPPSNGWPRENQDWAVGPDRADQSPAGRYEQPAVAQQTPRQPPATTEIQASWPPNDAATAPTGSMNAQSDATAAAERPVMAGQRRRDGYLEMPEFPETNSSRNRTAGEIQQTSAVEADGRYALSNDWDTQLQRVIGIIEGDLAKRPTPQTDDERAKHAELHAYLRMLYLMDGQQTRSLQAIPDMPPTHQEFWTQLFWGLTNYFDQDGIPDAGHRATETITQLRSAIEKLKPESRLQLRNATFSNEIRGFGNYERFDRDEFQASQPVLVYVEVQNFASELGSEGLYRTRLRTSVEIHKAGRGPDTGLVFSEDYPATEDSCRNLRQDYFHSYRVDLPATLTPGPHTLKLIVEDELSHRITSTTLNFTVR